MNRLNKTESAVFTFLVGSFYFWRICFSKSFIKIAKGTEVMLEKSFYGLWQTTMLESWKLSFGKYWNYTILVVNSSNADKTAQSDQHLCC